MYFTTRGRGGRVLYAPRKDVDLMLALLCNLVDNQTAKVAGAASHGDSNHGSLWRIKAAWRFWTAIELN